MICSETSEFELVDFHWLKFDFKIVLCDSDGVLFLYDYKFQQPFIGTTW